MGAMKVLLDTHALLWWLFDDPKLSTLARETISNPQTRVYISSASCWEISTKYRIGKLPEAEDAVRRLPVLLNQSLMDALPISVEHALAAGMLEGSHRDPFDRMLIAQAQIEKMPIVTLDPVFGRFNVEIVW